MKQLTTAAENQTPRILPVPEEIVQEETNQVLKLEQELS